MLRTDEARSNLVGNVMMDMLIDRTQTRIREIARGLLVEQSTEEDTEAGETTSIVPEETQAGPGAESDTPGTEQKATKSKKPAKKSPSKKPAAKRKKAEKQETTTAGQTEPETAGQKQES
jgi:hypothetical protein